MPEARISLTITGMARKRSFRCPTCNKIVVRADPEVPFCSERCRTIDLGKWASGGYVISTPITDPERFEHWAKDEEKSHERKRSN